MIDLNKKTATEKERHSHSARAVVRRRTMSPQSKAILLAVALREFLAHGYGGTSMSKIVKVAGVSKTTLYSRFASKEELFRAIIHAQIDLLSPSTSLQADTARPDLERGLKSYANHMLELGLQGDFLGVNRLIYSESHRFAELGAAAVERTELGVKHIRFHPRLC